MTLIATLTLIALVATLTYARVSVLGERIATEKARDLYEAEIVVKLQERARARKAEAEAKENARLLSIAQSEVRDLQMIARRRDAELQEFKDDENSHDGAVRAYARQLRELRQELTGVVKDRSALEAKLRRIAEAVEEPADD